MELSAEHLDSPGLVLWPLEPRGLKGLKFGRKACFLHRQRRKALPFQPDGDPHQDTPDQAARCPAVALQDMPSFICEASS